MPLPSAPEPPHPSSNYTEQDGRPSHDFFDYLKKLQRWGDAIGTAVLLDTRSAIATSTIAAGITHVIVAGYSTVGDGGEALYKRLASAPSPVKKYHVQSADGTWWIYAPSDKMNVKAIGAKGDNSQDEADYFDDIIALASGRKIYVPGGGAGYRFDRGLTSYAGPVSIEGDGNGQTTSPGTTYHTVATTFLINFDSAYLFTIDSAAPMEIQDILFEAVITQTDGGALYFTCTTGGLGPSPTIYGCAFNFVFNGIVLHKSSGAEISHRNVFNNIINAAIYIDTDGVFEGGGGTISGNIIIAYTPPRTIYGIYSECGYAKIDGNYIVGCVNAIVLHASISAGAFEVVQNQLEEHTGYGVLVSRNGSSGASAMLQIKDNEFSNKDQTGLTAHIAILDDSGADWIETSSITGNVLRSVMDTGGFYIKIDSGTGITCDMNEIKHLGGGSPKAIQMTGSAVKAPSYCRNNRFSNGDLAHTLGTLYDTSAAVVVHDTSLAYASLPAACANGSMFFVTDGKATNIAGGNYTLTNGGNGCLSVRCNGVHTVGGVA